MEYVERLRPRLGPRVWSAVVILALGTIGSAALSRPQPLTPSLVSGGALVTVLCTFAVAWVLAPLSPYPRWADWTSACVLSAWVVASAWLASSPEAWRSDVRPQMSFMPWFVLTLATASRRGQGACATVGSRAGWMLVGTSVLFGGILVFAERIGRML
jgi:hypothetical protein